MQKQTETKREFYAAPDCSCVRIQEQDVLCTSPNGGINDLVVDDFDWDEN